jgi:BirA family biotin operon repressor/biotin-[acetyl-CoA-carboxylase] ligase
VRPFRVHWFARLGSTNDHAALLRKRGKLFAPAIVLTSRQLAGRGRGAHRWWSPAGCLTVTFVLPIEDDIAPQQIPLLSGLAVRRAVAQLAGGAAIQLKWPNDIQYAGKKLGGLLCERLMKVDLIGLGLNVNVDPAKAPPDLRQRMTSIRQITGREQDMTDALVAVAAALRLIMRERSQCSFAEMLREYDEHHAMVGRQVSVIEAGDGSAISGKCEGLDEMGRLLVRLRGGTIERIVAGHVVAR